MRKINRFSMLILDGTDLSESYYKDITNTDIPYQAIDICKELVTDLGNLINEIWLFDNTICTTVAKIYKTVDNKALVKCYAVL